MIIEINEKIQQKIRDWDSCDSVDATGGKFLRILSFRLVRINHM
ncbi:hypothetical protein YDYSY3_18880 [Paenibacillus chitinolyticus]|nr:hypothetical protein YDYSY3_18880 [Paenibacillus chitinolyticus]